MLDRYVTHWLADGLLPQLLLRLLVVVCEVVAALRHVLHWHRAVCASRPCRVAVL